MGLLTRFRRQPSAADVLRWVGQELAEEAADLQTECRRVHAERDRWGKSALEYSSEFGRERGGVNRAQHIVDAALAALEAGQLRGASMVEVGRQAHRRRRRAVEADLEQRRQRIPQEMREKSG